MPRLFALLALIASLPSFASAAEAPGFFAVAPGMSRATLVKLLGEPDESTDASLAWALEGDEEYDLGVVELVNGRASVVVLSTPPDGPTPEELIEDFTAELGPPLERAEESAVFGYKVDGLGECRLVVQAAEDPREEGPSVLRMLARTYDTLGAETAEGPGPEAVDAVLPGMTEKEALALLGPPDAREAGRLLYAMPEKSGFLEAAVSLEAGAVDAVLLTCRPGAADAAKLIAARRGSGAPELKTQDGGAMYKLGGRGAPPHYLIVQPPPSPKQGAVLIRVGKAALEPAKRRL